MAVVPSAVLRTRLPVTRIEKIIVEHADRTAVADRPGYMERFGHPGRHPCDHRVIINRCVKTPVRVTCVMVTL